MAFSSILFLLFIGAPISVLIHEFGHAIAASCVNAKHITIYLGSGRDLFAFRLGRLKLVVRLFYFVGGLTTNERSIHYSKRELLWITSFGSVLNGFVAIILFFLMMWVPNVYLSIMFWFNLWLAIGNLLPIRINDKKTDGYTILEIFKRTG